MSFGWYELEGLTEVLLTVIDIKKKALGKSVVGVRSILSCIRFHSHTVPFDSFCGMKADVSRSERRRQMMLVCGLAVTFPVKFLKSNSHH